MQSDSHDFQQPEDPRVCGTRETKMSYFFEYAIRVVMIFPLKANGA